MRRLPALLLTTALTSCTAGGGMDAGPDAGVDAFVARPDTGPTTCESDPDCDDGFPCTLDECRVGNVCAYTALDARCNEGESCVVGRGCVSGSPTDCTDASECDDGDRCNGAERCLGNTCVPGIAPSCDDGNDCTIDTCDDALPGMCRYELAPGCDGGTDLADAGPMCEAFDPATDYAGSFRMLPGQACDGVGTDYFISSLSFSISGDTLTVTAGPFTLTQSPAPTGADFDVSGGDGCASVRITGSWECDERFRGTFMATHSGSCASCGTTSSAFVGRL